MNNIMNMPYIHQTPRHHTQHYSLAEDPRNGYVEHLWNALFTWKAYYPDRKDTIIIASSFKNSFKGKLLVSSLPYMVRKYF